MGIFGWMTQVKLKLNPSETEFIRIVSESLRKKNQIQQAQPEIWQS